MLLENLSNSLKNTLKRIAGSLFVDEALINDLVRDIQRALLRSDVNVRLVLDLTTKIKERALHEEAPGRLSKKEQLISIIYEELVGFLGEEEHAIEITKKPTTIMLVGLFGSGKTTTAAKLGKYLAKRGHKVALLQTDAYRPAAYEQLKQLGRAAGVDVLGNPKSKAALNIYREFEPELNKYDAVII
ncbi:signal recognition particle protein Srp19, partial [Candidatus Woesearchaeota archaeon CG10_big_fil_rev_8_21_14_0_10_47_5]